MKVVEQALPGSIPAWAGETDYARLHAEGEAVYPRVGGGNTRFVTGVSVEEGLSPRGRGKLSTAGCRGALGGSIPAWAGETVSV